MAKNSFIAEVTFKSQLLIPAVHQIYLQQNDYLNTKKVTMIFRRMTYGFKEKEWSSFVVKYFKNKIAFNDIYQ